MLEQQENLNVAQKVDAQKEEMIGQLRSSWKELVEHWKELEHQRQELALMLEEERVKSRNMKINFNHVSTYVVGFKYTLAYMLRY